VQLKTILASLVLLSGPFLILPETVSALPTPGYNCQVAAQANNPLVRYFPEAENTNDYIGYFEAQECFAALNKAYPDRMELKYVGKSYGHINRQSQARDRFDIPLIEVTNEKSAIPFEDKVKIVLMLSIHGNEKGGREGGFRVLEDYVRNIGDARTQATGHPGKTLYDLMDYSVLVLLFANPDGWAHDEPMYLAGKPGTMYERENGHGADLNRQLPTVGWHRPATGTRKTLSEPEPQAYAPALQNYTNVAYAADIHGMLTPADGCTKGVCAFTSDAAPTGQDIYGHFILGLISAGQLTPLEMLRSTRLANILTERLNNNPKFDAWSKAPATGVWGGEFYQWSTVWDTIGYTDSGISGDWFLQDSGLDAPGMDFEMAYNHITFDGAYPGAAQLANSWHLETVRQIARAYVEAAVTDVQTSIDLHGKTSAYLYNPKVFSSRQDRPLEGWAKDNTFDDLWDYEHKPYEAAPNDYFREMAPFLADGDRPAVFDELRVNEITKEKLAFYDNFVVAGSAIELVEGNPKAIEAIKAYVDAGGNLVLTDQSMKLLEALGAVPAGSVGVVNKYAGMTLLQDRKHELAKFSVPLSRQTYEPVPIGYPIGGQAPNWYVNITSFKAAGGEVVGVVPKSGSTGGGSTNPLTQTGAQVEANVGRMKIGAGSINFVGGLLPDPTQEHYHPYGLSSYATTYFGNLILYNALGAEQVFSQPPIILEKVGELRNQTKKALTKPSQDASAVGEGADSTPGFEALTALLMVAGAIVVLRRRQD
jgi:hypothetical protein